ncbi:hypothetical protein D3C86_2028080 [compost metagenome]
MGLPVQVEGEAVEQGADQLAAEGGEQAAAGTEQGEFGTTGAQQQPALCAQGAE